MSVGLDNPPGGPGKGPETPEKPTQPSTGGESPSTVPGADGRTPRIDSYKAAGQPVPGRSEAGTEQRGGREARPNESATGPAAEKPQTPGDPPSEADPKTKKEPETGAGGTGAEKPGQAKTENPRQDEGELGTDDRGSKTDRPEPGKAEGQDGGKDNDESESSEQPGTRAVEASQFPPGSRRASLAAAREWQEATAEERRALFQDTRTTNGPGEGTTSESGEGGLPPQSQDAGSNGRGPEAQPPGPETPPGAIGGSDTPDGGGDASGDGEGSGGRDQPAPGTPEVEAEPPAPEVPRPQDQEHEPPVPKDSSGSGDGGGEPPAEPPADASPPDDDQPGDGQDGDGKDGTPPGPEAGRPIEPTAETGTGVPEPGREASSTGPETTDQGNEPPEPKATDGTTGNETDDPKPPVETTPPPEGTGDNVPPPEPPGEQGDGHGKTAEGDGTGSESEETDESKPEVRPNPIISEVYTDSRGRVHVEPRYGREQTDEPGGDPVQNEPETTEPAGPPTRENLDPVGARGGEPGRDELRDPEDDRASRDYQEGKPDKLSRARGELKKFLNDSQNAQNSVKTFAEPTIKAFEKVKPTGQQTRTSPNTDRMKTPDKAIKSGDAFIGFIGTAIVLTETVRFGIRLARQRRENADHR
ncbi:hypothetical protein [Actinomadura luteofluorescens]|uniref:hypothetical protein n=1 Tax=Actinomadura luteofluorescens TaxID=46163 RepID=UPI0030D2CF76